MRKKYKIIISLFLSLFITLSSAVFALADDLLSFDSNGYVTACNTEATGRVEIPQFSGNTPVEGIAIGAFSGCTKVSEIIIPGTVKYIGGAAFSGCSTLASLSFPAGVTKVNKYTFQDCTALTAVQLSADTELIDEGAFWGCEALESITLPEGLTEIGIGAFYRSGIKSITLPEGLVTLGSAAFDSCENLNTVVFEGSVKAIGEWTFYGCTALEKIELPYGLVSIGGKAFENCTALKEVTIPESVTYIANDAFSGCADFEIIGCAGSTAETYAKENNIPFRAELKHTHTYGDWVIESMPEGGANALLSHTCTSCGERGETLVDTTTVTTGDANGDGTVAISDAVVISRYCAGLSSLSAEGAFASNVNHDSSITVSDAVLIARYCAGLIEL